MATYLFHMVEDKPERVLVDALLVEGLLSAGYCVCIEDLDGHTEEINEDSSEEDNNSESEDETESNEDPESDDNDNDNKELTIDEVKELAKAAGITVGRKGIKTLKKELGI